MNSPKHVLVFIGIVVFVFGIITLPWTFGFARGQLAQLSQDRRAAASDDVWCYTHILDSVWGHPPGLTQEEVIASNRMPFVTDGSIEDTEDRTDCYETWTEAWEATDPELQAIFSFFFSHGGTEEDYAAILPLTGQELDELAYATQVAQATAIASGETTEEEVEATATAQLTELSEGFDEEGMTWCATLMIAPEENDEFPSEYRLFFTHPAGTTYRDIVVQMIMREELMMDITEFQRLCYPTADALLSFIRELDEEMDYTPYFVDLHRGNNVTPDADAEIWLNYAPRSTWNMGNMNGFVITNELEIEVMDAAFGRAGSPLSITFEADPETLERVDQLEGVSWYHPKDELTWCDTILAEKGEIEHVAIVSHYPDTPIEEIVATALADPDVAIEPTDYATECWEGSNLAGRVRGSFTKNEVLIDATGEARLNSEIKPLQELLETLQRDDPVTVSPEGVSGRSWYTVFSLYNDGQPIP